MPNPITLGSVCLGILIGSLVRTVVFQTEKLTEKTLLSLVAVMVGATVLGMFKAFSGEKMPEQVYFYPVGLLVGYAGTLILQAVLRNFYK